MSLATKFYTTSLIFTIGQFKYLMKEKKSSIEPEETEESLSKKWKEAQKKGDPIKALKKLLSFKEFVK